jgi:hypothetical protein
MTGHWLIGAATVREMGVSSAPGDDRPLKNDVLSYWSIGSYNGFVRLRILIDILTRWIWIAVGTPIRAARFGADGNCG